MKLFIPAILLLSACTQDILGIPRGDRFQLYGGALSVLGHPEVGVIIGGVGRRLKAIDKQPLNVNPEGK